MFKDTHSGASPAVRLGIVAGLGIHLAIIVACVVSLGAYAFAAEPRGVLVENLTVAPEKRCERYDRNHYRMFVRTKRKAIENMGGDLYSPYTMKTYQNKNKVDADHIVALAEAHDSGACKWPTKRKRDFANDLDNVTLAPQALNRHQKRAKDAAEWLLSLIHI